MEATARRKRAKDHVAGETEVGGPQGETCRRAQSPAYDLVDHVAKKKKAETSSFLEKLYEILEDPQYAAFVGWCPKGESIIVKKVAEFSSKVLPKFFKTSNFQSFVRQLNMYSFKKTRHDADWREFKQDEFQRGKRHLFSKIKRKTGSSSTLQKFVKAKKTEERTLTDISHVRREVSMLIDKQKASEHQLEQLRAKYNNLRQVGQLIWKLVLEDPNISQERAREMFVKFQAVQAARERERVTMERFHRPLVGIGGYGDLPPPSLLAPLHRPGYQPADRISWPNGELER